MLCALFLIRCAIGCGHHSSLELFCVDVRSCGHCALASRVKSCKPLVRHWSGRSRANWWLVTSRTKKVTRSNRTATTTTTNERYVTCCCFLYIMDIALMDIWAPNALDTSSCVFGAEKASTATNIILITWPRLSMYKFAAQLMARRFLAPKMCEHISPSTWFEQKTSRTNCRTRKAHSNIIGHFEAHSAVELCTEEAAASTILIASQRCDARK